MALRNAILQELHNEYEQRRNQNEQENMRRRAAAEAACPELREALDARQSMVFTALRGILDGSASADDMPQRMEVQNRRIASLLTKHGLGATYLDPVFRCKRCEDTGYVGEIIREQCDCFRNAFYSRLYQRMGLAESRVQSFETFDLSLFSDEIGPNRTFSQRQVMQVHRQTCQRYAEEFPKVQTRNLLLMGQSGLGKTFMMHAMAKVLLQRGMNVLMISAFEFLKIARKAYMTDQNAELDDLLDCEVLFIDDMGSEPLMENITILQWFNLINERQLRGKGTVISTNLRQEEIRQRYTERIASRLMNQTDCRLLQFIGEDVRRTMK